ncbi:(Fe-S)-binding protein [Methanobacterium sp.]|uniref:(Fe-S)-binding protein n=1 Tax=Methanobacterium sp. TaxID=2164 RepID=UPI0025FC3A85|nr:(Fe-S)-binding protein [Methanobacterium sp.]MBI5459114.1 (Fe-S)-binding protein [Methanobacterium sp.]MDY9923057.1 (Fe-S)-binding protein [Methanobacterium sp.]
MIYFRGCLSREKLQKIPDATEKLLKKAGINYKILNNEGCCGSVLLRTGFHDDALNIMQDTLQDLKGEKVLVSCAGCYRTFKEDYPEILGQQIDVIHTSQLFSELIEKGKLELSVTNEKVTYHDPCHLGRHMGEYETPRKVMDPYAELVEMERNQEKARCCGAGGGVRSAFQELSGEIACKRMDDAKSTGATTLVTCCPFCILNLESQEDSSSDNLTASDNLTEEKKGNLNIIDLSQFLLKRLNHE